MYGKFLLSATKSIRRASIMKIIDRFIEGKSNFASSSSLLKFFTGFILEYGKNPMQNMNDEMTLMHNSTM
jgi:hypothetical protein